MTVQSGINFPPLQNGDPLPTDGQEFTPEGSNSVWVYSSATNSWSLKLEDFKLIISQDTPPAIQPDKIWFNSAEGKSYFGYVDPSNHAYWVSLSVPGPQGEVGPTGPTGPAASPDSILYTYPGGVEQTVQARLEQRVSVKDFGAVGDGVTDDMLAIQKAINYCYDNGISELYMPAGEYFIEKFYIEDLDQTCGSKPSKWAVFDAPPVNEVPKQICTNLVLNRVTLVGQGRDETKILMKYLDDTDTVPLKDGTMVLLRDYRGNGQFGPRMTVAGEVLQAKNNPVLKFEPSLESGLSDDSIIIAQADMTTAFAVGESCQVYSCGGDPYAAPSRVYPNGGSQSQEITPQQIFTIKSVTTEPNGDSRIHFTEKAFQDFTACRAGQANGGFSASGLSVTTKLYLTAETEWCVDAGLKNLTIVPSDGTFTSNPYLMFSRTRGTTFTNVNFESSDDDTGYAFSCSSGQETTFENCRFIGTGCGIESNSHTVIDRTQVTDKGISASSIFINDNSVHCKVSNTRFESSGVHYAIFGSQVDYNNCEFHKYMFMGYMLGGSLTTQDQFNASYYKSFISQNRTFNFTNCKFVARSGDTYLLQFGNISANFSGCRFEGNFSAPNQIMFGQTGKGTADDVYFKNGGQGSLTFDKCQFININDRDNALENYHPLWLSTLNGAGSVSSFGSLQLANEYVADTTIGLTDVMVLDGTLVNSSEYLGLKSSKTSMPRPYVKTATRIGADVFNVEADLYDYDVLANSVTVNNGTQGTAPKLSDIVKAQVNDPIYSKLIQFNNSTTNLGRPVIDYNQQRYVHIKEGSGGIYRGSFCILSTNIFGGGASYGFYDLTIEVDESYYKYSVLLNGSNSKISELFKSEAGKFTISDSFASGNSVSFNIDSTDTTEEVVVVKYSLTEQSTNGSAILVRGQNVNADPLISENYPSNYGVIKIAGNTTIDTSDNTAGRNPRTLQIDVSGAGDPQIIYADNLEVGPNFTVGAWFRAGNAATTDFEVGYYNTDTSTWTALASTTEISQNYFRYLEGVSTDLTSANNFAGIKAIGTANARFYVSGIYVYQ